jgi:hypothetical protein
MCIVGFLNESYKLLVLNYLLIIFQWSPNVSPVVINIKCTFILNSHLNLNHGYYGAKAINLTKQIMLSLWIVFLTWSCWGYFCDFVSRRTHLSVARSWAYISEFVFLVCLDGMDAEEWHDNNNVCWVYWLQRIISRFQYSGASPDGEAEPVTGGKVLPLS